MTVPTPPREWVPLGLPQEENMTGLIFNILFFIFVYCIECVEDYLFNREINHKVNAIIGVLAVGLSVAFSWI